MGAHKTSVVTQAPELKYQLEHPSLATVRERAIEVFGNPELAHQWLNTVLPILGATPEGFAASADPAKSREVLEILARIDFGMFE
jgi:uncharacterized protein (DUF2384 family)